MPKNYYEDIVHANIYEFKTNISHYIRMMEAGLYKQVLIKRRNRPIGIFVLFDQEKHGEKLKQIRLK